MNIKDYFNLKLRHFSQMIFSHACHTHNIDPALTYQKIWWLNVHVRRISGKIWEVGVSQSIGTIYFTSRSVRTPRKERWIFNSYVVIYRLSSAEHP